MAIQVKSVNQLKEILADGETKDFFIQLNFGLRSSKCVSYDGETFYILNSIDDTEQELSESELMNNDITNIGKAINCGAFYLES